MINNSNKTEAKCQEAGITYHIRDALYDDAPVLADIVIEPIITIFRGRVPDQCLTWLTKEESCANWQKWFQCDRSDGQFLLVAVLRSQLVVGCALGGVRPIDHKFQGELRMLGVLPGYQGQGIGRHLVGAVAARLLEQGIQSMWVGVLSVNPNRRFYERLGGQYLSERPYEWNGVLLTEVIYGWTDITCFLLG